MTSATHFQRSSREAPEKEKKIIQKTIYLKVAISEFLLFSFCADFRYITLIFGVGHQILTDYRRFHTPQDVFSQNYQKLQSSLTFLFFPLFFTDLQ